MECNKDEAIRAKGIAEKKLENDDFEGARKFARKAQHLFPELENISQLLTVCDVHCSARNKICGTEMDWYGILQVERLADEVTIKKQYRKLALVLHPDKNKFPGAEAAFKLVGESNMVLSDQGKRSLYDSKCRVSMRTAIKPPPHQFNQNPSGRKQNGPTQPDSSNVRQTFWTSCPFCNIRYQYYRDHVNRALSCQKCSKTFIAYDLGARGVPPGSNYNQPAFSQQKQVPCQGSFKAGSQSTGAFPPQMRPQGCFRSKTVGSEPVSKTPSTAEAGGSYATNVKEGCANVKGEKVGSAKVDTVKPRETRTSIKASRKRGRKSSESCDTKSSADTPIVQGNVGSFAEQNFELNGIRCPQRSSQKRKHISRKERLNDDDNVLSPLKKSGGSVLHRDSTEELNEEAFDHGTSKTDNSTGFAAAADRDNEDITRKGTTHEGIFPNRSGKAGGAVMADRNANKHEVINGCVSDSDNSCAPDPEPYECPDPEFNDFDKHKEENCFAVDQIWACYDPADGMPRFYARVRKVFSPGFRLRITWLEPDPEDQGGINWLKEGFPVACGRFIHGSSQAIMGRLTFSHQVHCEKGSGRCAYMIYPRKGETWALFKDWDVSWRSDPENQKKYKFEFVEVISDFAEDVGIGVVYLDKVQGFVSVFQKTTREGVVSFLIQPIELLRFSHQIPSVKLTGTEREGVPEGSFEFDPASLPANFDECCLSGDMNLKTESLDVKANGSNHKTPKKDGNSMKSSVTLNTPKKDVGFEGKNGLEKEMLKLRRSPRKLNNKDNKQDQVNASGPMIHDRTAKDLDDAKDKKYGGVGTSSSQVDEKINSPMKDASPQCSAKSGGILPTFSQGGTDLVEFHNFNVEKSAGKFRPGQIWALYSDTDGLPKNYTQVKKIESSPFRLHVVMLEACTLPKDKSWGISCGTFKLQSGKAKVISPSSFSHALKVESIGKSSFEIYPREGEVWALYKDWNADDQENCKYEIVVVLEDNEQCTKVSPLIQMNGYTSVFKAPRRLRSSSGIMEIPRVELARFSHQIPSFKLTGEKDGSLRDCLELDPASIPGNMFSSAE